MYMNSERARLMRNFNDSLTDAHKLNRELKDMGVSQETLAILDLLRIYGVGRGNTRPKDDTLRGIMDSKEYYRNRRPQEEEDEKLMEWRKTLDVLRKYLDVHRCIIQLYNDGASVKTVWGQTVIDRDHSY
ncbi:unnamed protein product, partial [marine sediment metagenome]